jgi:hypothetical protein
MVGKLIDLLAFEMQLANCMTKIYGSEDFAGVQKWRLHHQDLGREISIGTTMMAKIEKCVTTISLSYSPTSEGA